MQENTVKMVYGTQELIIGTGTLAKQADGAVTIQCGGTVVLVTACMSLELREGQDFFPLTVECQEKTYAAGRFPGGFFKREGRPTESEILTARLIDRPLRPLFPKGFINEVQIMAVVLSSDGENDPDILAVNGASAALSISPIPFNGPIGSCRVGRVADQLVLNPTYAELEKSDLDIVIVANKQAVVMLESRANEVSEELYMQGVEFGFQQIQGIIALQEELVSRYGKKKTVVECKTISDDLKRRIADSYRQRYLQAYNNSVKSQREDILSEISKEALDMLSEQGFLAADIKNGLHDLEQELVRNKIINEKIRTDSRGYKDIRPITCSVSLLPRAHGSSLFTRGQTQSLAVTTLGTGDDEQLIESLEGSKYKTFMLHYNFPPFSVGETKPVRGPGRREIGHGALAEKAFYAVIPSKEKFPYTVRVVSEILESNGSSSMATVCAATLALMDAGVPIKEPVAGVALGLVKEGDTAAILSDIAGVEDHFGDMDFKVTGTRNGITAVQMDLKIQGISLDLVRESMQRAKEGRFFVLEKMTAALSAPRAQMSAYAPRIEVIKVNPERIGELIGPGGKNIKAIIASTGATIDIQDDGSVLVGSNDAGKAQDAIRMIRAATDDIEVGSIMIGKIKRIMNFGAFCEIAPRKEGLIHVSELSAKFVKNVEEAVKIGDEVKVKVIGIDELGRINLSIKQALAPGNSDERKETK